MEIQRLKALKSPKGWIKPVPDTDSLLYFNDLVKRIKGVGKNTEKQLMLVGIHTLGELSVMTDEKLKKISSIKLPRLIRLHDTVKESLFLEDRPKDINYLIAANPYQARYEKDWETEMEKSTSLSRYVCVTKVIDHVYEESGKVFIGTTHEEDWLFYQDTLSLMTTRESIEYMKKGIL